MKTKQNIREKALIVFFLLSLSFFLVLNIFLPRDPYLYYENRMVQEKPEFTSKNVFSGSYFNSLETYFIDSFALRSELLKLGTRINLRLKRPNINDLYVSNNNILSIWKDWKLDYPKKEIEQMALGYEKLSQNLREKNIDFIYVGIPEHSSIFAQEYPGYFYNRGQEWLKIEDEFFYKLDSRGVKNIKMRDHLKSDPYLYYTKTDHHFSYIGALESYKQIVKEINSSLGLKLDYNSLKLKKLDKDFKGSYSRKLFNKDKFVDQAFIYEEDFNYTRKDKGQKVKNRIFHLDNLKDGYYSYGLYMGGDIGLTEINTNRQDLPNILVYGDSFTNPIETLLVRNANNFYSVDFRHYKDKQLLELVEDLKPDIVVLIRDNLMYLNNENNGILN